MVQMPTGIGKLHSLASVIHEHLQERQRQSVWIATHRRELVEQIEDTVVRYGIRKEEGLVCSSQWLSHHWEDVENDRSDLIVIERAAAAARVRLSWPTRPRRCLPRCILTAASARPARSSTAYCSTPSARRSPRKSAATTRPFCRNSCSARRTRRFPTACLVRAAPTMTRRSILKCCSTAALWARARAAARRKPSRWPQKTRSKN